MLLFIDEDIVVAVILRAFRLGLILFPRFCLASGGTFCSSFPVVGGFIFCGPASALFLPPVFCLKGIIAVGGYFGPHFLSEEVGISQ